MNNSVGNDNQKSSEELHREFRDKANSYANWFSAILISTFVFLINLKGNQTHIWRSAFVLAMIGLITIFLFKFLSTTASYLRLNPKAIPYISERTLESCCEVLMVFFVISSIGSVVLAFLLFWSNLFGID